MLRIVAFLIGTLQRTYVQLVGQLPIAELLHIVVGPLLAMSRTDVFRVRGAKTTLFLGSCWFGSLILSDFLNGTVPDDFLRGWANVFMILLAFVAWMALAAREPSKVAMFYLAGLCIAGAVAVVRGQTRAEVGGEWWDTSVRLWANPLTILGMWWVYRFRPSLSMAIALGYGLASIAFGSRSNGLLFLMTAALMFASRAVARNQYAVNRAQILRGALIAVPVLAVMFCTYVFLGTRGVLGANAQAQLVTLRQPYNPFHVILSSRPEGLAGLRAIIDRPLFGHGSWARNARYTRFQGDLIESISKPGVTVNIRVKEANPMIPAHSVVLASWIWGGLAGGLFWIFQMYLFFQLMVFFFKRPHLPVAPLALYAGLSVAWNVPFSAFGFARLAWPIYLAVLLVERYHVEWREREYALQQITLQSEHSVVTPQSTG